MFGLLIIVGQLAVAQCIPDPQYTEPGVYPDTATGLPCAVNGVLYSEVITLVAPADTVIGGVPLPIDSLVLTSLTGLPPGIGFTCGGTLNNSTYSWAGGTAGCINLTGVSTINDTYNILAIVESYLVGATTSAGTEYVDYYSITVADSCIVGVVEIGQPGFKGLQNIPNPFVDETEIQFTLTEIGSIKFAVYNLLGNMVYSEDLVGKSGLNKVDFSAKGIAPGIYMYHVKKDLSTATGRMVITR